MQRAQAGELPERPVEVPSEARHLDPVDEALQVPQAREVGGGALRRRQARVQRVEHRLREVDENRVKEVASVLVERPVALRAGARPPPARAQ